MGVYQAKSGPIVTLLAQGVGHNGIAQVLRTVRKHLGMDVAFISRFRETDRVFEHVDADGAAPIHQGQAIPLEDGYCLEIVRGELPELIPDTSVVPAAMALSATHQIPIGAHLSIPIELSSGKTYGTLCCFSRVGMELELRAIKNALGALNELPLPLSLSLNSSPELIVSGRLELALRGTDLSRIVIEITEHASVTDYSALLRALAPLRGRGARLAIDDAGAGYASMRHILNLKADVIKLDMSLTRDIDTDSSRRALAKGLIAFAHEIQSSITAEGVETEMELATLRSIGVDKVQGFFLSRPRALGDIMVAHSVAPRPQN